MTYLLFVIGFVILIKGADFMVSGASSIAKKFNVSDLIIGLTIVAFGTSAPELVVNVISGIQGSSGLAVGNVIGSNISNIFLILGISAMIYPLKVHKNTVWKEIPFALLGVLVLSVVANDMFLDKLGFNAITRSEGISLLLFFTIFVYYTFSMIKSTSNNSVETEEVKPMPLYKSIFFVVIGLAGLVFGGNWIVNGAVQIATTLGMDETLIGLTIVAIGTSLPELATSAVAAWKKQTDIAVGNIIGSNIFNVFWILGVSAVINPLEFDANSNIDIFVNTVATTLIFIFCFIGRRHTLQRWQGGMFVAMYVAYIVGIVVLRG
jgi:cation:H+ antiporter